MKNLKRLGLSLIIGLITIFGINTISNASLFDDYPVGRDDFGVSYNTYINSKNIYCVEKGQALSNFEFNYFRVVSQVRIEGDTSTDHTGKKVKSPANIEMLNILTKDNGSVKEEGPVAQGIWRYMPTWMKFVGRQHAGLRKFNVIGSQDPANSLGNSNKTQSTEIKDNTNKDKIKVVSYEKDGTQYMRVGPFNWSFSGKIKNVTVKDQNGKSISGILFSSFNGKNETWFNVGNIKSGKDFYISIPANKGVSKITQISATQEIDTKAVNICFLEAADGSNQNLIMIETSKGKGEGNVDFDYNISILGNLKVIKVNANNEEIKLPGVGFIIEQKTTGKYVKQASNGTITYVDNREDATEFVTDENGEILIKNLVVGTYIAYETKNPNYGYEIIKDGQEGTVVVDKTATLKIGNRQIYVKLSGYVWTDMIYGKESIRNDLFKDNEYDINDILLDGITVRLKDKSGSTIKETVTSNGGAYQFTDVLIDKLGDYYIEFEYDGLTYTNVVPHIDKDNGSKAAESTNGRNEFNQNFSVVEGKTSNTGITRDASGNEKYELSYNIDKSAHRATLINNGQYLITANTNETGYVIKDHYQYGQEEIKYINLGLYEREQPDIALKKDIENVRLTINGYEHTYQYAQRYLNEGEYGDGFNVGVKFADKYMNMQYTRPIYKADYEYINENDKSKELKVYITYAILLENQSSNLTATVNSIVDYYDSRYTLVNAGTALDEKGNVIDEINDIDPGASYNSNYTKTILHHDLRIEAGKEAKVYVQFELNREAVLNILNDGENLDNVAEINSYSIFDKDGNIYAGIDIDSAPGNATPEDRTTFEDDTDLSPALKLEVADARELTGKVFLDSTREELVTGEVRRWKRSI